MFTRVLRIYNKTIFMDFIEYVFDFCLLDVLKTFQRASSRDQLYYSFI